MTMQPGPELDLKVWRALFAADREGDAYIETRPEHLCGREPYLEVCWHLEGDCFGEWSPSTNIAHAWEVVDRLLESMPGIVARINRDAFGTMCRLISEQGDGLASAHRETTAHAICLAALKAVGVDVDA